jgi:aspartate kinase
MLVFKFGGASLKDASALANMTYIVRQYGQEKELLIVVSAMGKTTNALEKILYSFWDEEPYEEHIEALNTYHHSIVRYFFNPPDNPIYGKLAAYFTELRSILDKAKRENFNQLYDTVVAFGEILSSVIVAEYLNQHNIACEWIDARQNIRTDNTWREGKVDWTVTHKNINATLRPILAKKIIITQGFIGGTSTGDTTTLGREGSDYSAAIFAHCLDAEAQTIWKDVPGVLNADPKRIADAQLFAQLSYQEASEMTYYGATVIHPKTIAPLYRKKIPLYVKSFLQPQKSGTCINSIQARKFIPAIMFKAQQILVHLTIKAFGFITETEVARILQLFTTYEAPVYLIHKTAFRIAICTDNRTERIEAITREAKRDFEILLAEDLELLSVKDADEATLSGLKTGRQLLLEIKQENFYQAVFKC